MSLNPKLLAFCLRIDCAGILKLRNSDIELRKGETDIGRKNTRVRLVFRVHINQPNGRTVSLQASSNPIECCKSQIQLTHWRGILGTKSKSWIVFFGSFWSKKQSLWESYELLVTINTSSPIRWALHIQRAIDSSHLMPSTHAIDHDSHWMTEGKSCCAETTPLTDIPHGSFARPSFGLTVRAHWKRALFLC